MHGMLHASSRRRQPASDQQSNQQNHWDNCKRHLTVWKEEEVGRAQELSLNLVGLLKNPSNILGVFMLFVVYKRNHGYLFRLLNPGFCAPLFLFRLAKNSCFRRCFSFSHSFFSALVMGLSVCGKDCHQQFESFV